MPRRPSRIRSRSSGTEDGSSLLASLLAAAAAVWILALVAAVGGTALAQLQLNEWSQEAVAAASAALASGPSSALAAGERVLHNGPRVVQDAQATWTITPTVVTIELTGRPPNGLLASITLHATATQRGP